ncbi:F0F1 ATP synthase subunit delta [Dysgonomonas sp. 216]|uniref:F0F1 ATP synthase subunit delta n=1 Tax=Dysgonomonas sp. 216 TaxID=2302934 RepID=UPI0013D3048A|nr:F0F1 ATP synthase subunit delta [Dysgonomonas sp. 216]NDW19379.1 F0F1 ATP synthase subunit delta [Dysgonomonas sp. 216]
MNSGIISMRYARALFEFALDKKSEDVVFNEMKSVSLAFSKTKKLRVALDNPVLDFKTKFDLMKSIAGNNPSDVYIRFIQLLLHQRRENHLQTISLIYLDLYRKHKNIRLGKLVTAYPVNDEVISKMKNFLSTGKSDILEFESVIDPDIDGGFILYIDTFRLDASVATQLRNIKRQLINKNNKGV